MAMPISDKLCECGCGQFVRIARQTIAAYGQVKGQPVRFVQGHSFEKKATTKTYRVARGERNRRLHVVRAERALGHPLPLGAEVHHADGTKNDNAPLVICQDRAYHMLLHRLLRVKRAGGNPHKHRICHHCKRVLPFDEFVGDVFNSKPRCGSQCKKCARERVAARKRRLREAAVA